MTSPDVQTGAQNKSFPQRVAPFLIMFAASTLCAYEAVNNIDNLADVPGIMINDVRHPRQTLSTMGEDAQSAVSFNARLIKIAKLMHDAGS